MSIFYGLNRLKLYVRCSKRSQRRNFNEIVLGMFRQPPETGLLTKREGNKLNVPVRAGNLLSANVYDETSKIYLD